MRSTIQLSHLYSQHDCHFRAGLSRGLSSVTLGRLFLTLSAVVYLGSYESSILLHPHMLQTLKECLRLLSWYLNRANWNLLLLDLYIMVIMINSSAIDVSYKTLSESFSKPIFTHSDNSQDMKEDCFVWPPIGFKIMWYLLLMGSNLPLSEFITMSSNWVLSLLKMMTAEYPTFWAFRTWTEEKCYHLMPGSL